MSHPFGDLVSQHLHRKHGLSQSKLAAGILQPPTVITAMCKGGRLTGPRARERVIAIVGWLHQQDALSTLDEANAMLNAAGMAALRETAPSEALLLDRLSWQRMPESLLAVNSLVPRSEYLISATTQTRFVGRQNEIASLHAALSSTRLITLTGIGGCGKTRLALELAHFAHPNFANGVRLIELEPLATFEDIVDNMAHQFGIRETSLVPLLDQVIRKLHDQHILLIMDNCEHLLEACNQVITSLIKTCSRVHMLCTSRIAIGVPGELVSVLPPLHHADAMKLFVERASTAAPTFRMTGDNASSVATICSRLDGIPLAIELAAARVQIAGVDEIAKRLDAGIHDLRTHEHDAFVPARQRVLQAVLDWSFAALSHDAQDLLSRLAVFIGGCSLAGIEQVCCDERLSTTGVLDIVAQLIQSSWLLVEYHEHEVRYRLLEPLRQFVAAQFDLRPDHQAIVERHAEWCLSLANSAHDNLGGLQQGIWLDRLERDINNMRAALEVSRRHKHVDVLLPLTFALCTFWRVRGQLREGRAWLECCLHMIGEEPSASRTRCLNRLGWFSMLHGDLTQARSWRSDALAMGGSLRLDRECADALMGLGDIEIADGNFELAERRLSHSLHLYDKLNDWRGIALVQHGLGKLSRLQGEWVRASDYLKKSLETFTVHGDSGSGLMPMLDLASVIAHTGDTGRAEELFHNALGLAHQYGDKSRVAWALIGLSDIAARRGDSVRAANLREEGVNLYHQLGELV